MISNIARLCPITIAVIPIVTAAISHLQHELAQEVSDLPVARKEAGRAALDFVSDVQKSECLDRVVVEKSFPELKHKKLRDDGDADAPYDDERKNKTAEYFVVPFVPLQSE